MCIYIREDKIVMKQVGKESIKWQRMVVYDSKQNYGATKITVELRKNGEVISERTAGLEYDALD